MLLYQLAQWMEERSSLHKALQAGGEDLLHVQSQISRVEEQLYAQAERWKQAIEETSLLQVPYEAPHLDDDPIL
ncbi:hypothetical protein B5M42_011280 [Paenibacillus athensensis]|uniref:Uncharacterized protein n=1 Tax=Paenibacillus athensensis TaxID=1967502 RepID=A0A4Y8PVT0_9BACL|nr:hypothetical protein [Paenibacillus athensensis]MCD1259416.1 hypothetical protein [Paenibacillus athensensis]